MLRYHGKLEEATLYASLKKHASSNSTRYSQKNTFSWKKGPFSRLRFQEARFGFKTCLPFKNKEHVSQEDKNIQSVAQSEHQYLKTLKLAYIYIDWF